ncbi:MAG: hypothetical protein EHM43_05180 [Ignavibacteriae bacterium]|nr:MAG: hypothetical protein EHM43_05180 [Ignavibacteriota bacterium]
MSYIPERGDVAWMLMDPTAGHEQAGQRQVVVLTPRAYNQASGLALVVPITTKSKGYPFEVEVVVPKKTNGVALCDQLRTIDHRVRKLKKIGVISAHTLDLILSRSRTLLEA